MAAVNLPDPNTTFFVTEHVTNMLTLCVYCTKPWGRGKTIAKINGADNMCGCLGCVNRVARILRMRHAPLIARKGGRAGAFAGGGRVVRSIRGMS